MKPEAPQPLPEHAKDVLALFRDAEDIPADVKDRIHRRLEEPEAGAVTTRPEDARPTAWIWTAVIVAAAAALLFTISALLPDPTTEEKSNDPVQAPHQATQGDDEKTYGIRGEDPRPMKSPRKAEPAPVIAPAPPPPEVEPTKEQARPRPQKKAAPEPEAAPSSADALAEERRIIARAWKALAGGRHAEALRQAAIHEERFAQGALSPERRAVSAIAACKSGAAGAERAAAFGRKHPRSPLLARVRDACDKK